MSLILFYFQLKKIISYFLRSISFLSIFSILFVFSCKKNLFAEEKEIKIKLNKLADQILSKMTDEEKAGQVIHISIPKNYLDEVAIQELKKMKPGGVILFGVNLGTEKEIRTLTKNLQLEMKNQNSIPLFISTDQEGGRVVRVEKAVTSFPGALALGQTKNKNYAEDVGFITSYELRKLGINVVFAPVLDMNNNPENPVINTRSFGMNLESSEIALSYEKGARKGGAIPVIKHFPGHGDTTVDSHIGLPIIQKSVEELEKFELIPFKNAIQSGAKAVMSAHIIYPNLDKNLPATLSEKVLTDLLRKKLEFDGVVFTDAMEMEAISKNYIDQKPGIQAILAGADIILLTSWGKNTSFYYSMILEGIKNKDFIKNNINILDQAVKRQILLKLEAGLFHTNYSNIKIDDKELEEYFIQKKKINKEKYTLLKENSISELNKKISTEAIRSYQEKFTPYDLKESKNFIYSFKNEILQSELNKLDLSFYTEKTLTKVLQKNKKSIIVLDSKEQSDLESVYKLAKKHSNREFILLHFGSPYLELPNLKNCKIIFSFSPTKESLSALLNRVINSNQLILPAELIYRKSKLE
jgi:beta-N-acetylhexosaminidase